MVTFKELFERKKKLKDNDIFRALKSIEKFHKSSKKNNNNIENIHIVDSVQKKPSLERQVKKGKLDPNRCDVILFPINYQQSPNCLPHWTAGVYFNNKSIPQVFHYDSLGNFNKSAFEDRLNELKEVGLIREDTLDLSPLTYFTQESNWECGYFTIFSFFCTVHTGKSIIHTEFTSDLNKLLSKFCSLLDSIIQDFPPPNTWGDDRYE